MLGLLSAWGQCINVTKGGDLGHPVVKHLECMIGCGIAFHTAALITIVNSVLKLQLPGALNLVPWLLPTVIGVPAIIVVSARYAKKLEGS